MSRFPEEIEIQATPNSEPERGSYRSCFIKVKLSDHKDFFWAGRLIVDATQLSMWRNGISDEDKLIELAKLKVMHYHLLGLLAENEPGDDHDIGIHSFEVGGKSYSDYISSLKSATEITINGRELLPPELAKLWNWTKNDILRLSSCHSEAGIEFPSSGFSIFLFSLMDIWGSVMNGHFGKRGTTEQNIGKVLKTLKQQDSDGNYDYSPSDHVEITDRLRNNLVHNYGLRVLSTNLGSDWPTIDTNVPGKIINLTKNGRWHVDCLRLSHDLLRIFEGWLQSNHPEALAHPR